MLCDVVSIAYSVCLTCLTNLLTKIYSSQQFSATTKKYNDDKQWWAVLKKRQVETVLKKNKMKHWTNINKAINN